MSLGSLTVSSSDATVVIDWWAWLAVISGQVTDLGLEVQSQRSLAGVAGRS